MLFVNARDGSWWVGAADDPRSAGWPCDTRDAAIALAHAVLAAGRGGDVVIHDRDGLVVRKDSVNRAPRPSRGVRQVLVQMPDGDRLSFRVDPEAAQRSGRLVVGGVQYRLAGIDLSSEPPLLILAAV